MRLAEGSLIAVPARVRADKFSAANAVRDSQGIATTIRLSSSQTFATNRRPLSNYESALHNTYLVLVRSRDGTTPRRFNAMSWVDRSASHDAT
jgi:hypothetical protein